MLWVKRQDTEKEEGTLRENVILIERGFNMHSMYDNKVDVNERCHTFEALSA